MSHTITINVSDTLYKQLRRAASFFHQPAETIVINSLNHTLPPLFEDIPADYQDDVFPLLAMEDRELQKEAQRTFPRERWQVYESLLERKKAIGLTKDEKQTLDVLRREADVLTFRRSYAAVLLKRRGYIISLRQENTKTSWANSSENTSTHCTSGIVSLWLLFDTGTREWGANDN